MKTITEYPENHNTLSGRLVIYLNKQGITPSRLALMIDKKQSTISAILKGGSPTTSTLLLIKNALPELNLDWLVTGNGVMIISDVKKESLVEIKRSESNEVKKESEENIHSKDYWILYGKYEQLQSEVFWQRELITDGLVQYREQARNKPQPSSQEQAAGQVSQSADSGGNVVAKEPLSDETKKAIAEGIKKRNELIIDPGGQKE